MTDMTVASQGFSYAAFESAAMTRLIEDTARAWLRSFGIMSDAQANQRLINALRDALENLTDDLMVELRSAD